MKINMGISLIMISVMIGVQLGGVHGFKSFNVGGANTWRVPDGNDTNFFDQWASSKRFHVGDSLHFQYVIDSVLIVDKYGYYHCDTSKATASFNNGNTVIKLERSGLTYFISGSVDHCRSGQRLIVDVMSPHSSTAKTPPESHVYQAEPPSPAQAPAEAYHSGSQSLLQVSAVLLGLVATSLFFV